MGEVMKGGGGDEGWGEEMKGGGGDEGWGRR